MTPKRRRKPLSTEEMADFIAGRLTQAISQLKADSLLGPWRGPPAGRPHPTPPRGRLFVPCHADDFLEMCLVLKGECLLRCGQHYYAARAGTLGMYAPGTAHGSHFRRERTSYEVVVWMTKPEGLVMAYHGYTFREGRVYFGRIQLQPPGQEARSAGRHLLQLVSHTQRPSVVSLKEPLLTLSLCLLRKALAEPDKDGSAARCAAVKEARAYVEQRLDRAVSVPEVAHYVMLSPNYLSSAFREETGLSLGHYIKSRRVDAAKELLATTTRSVKDIAYALGFNDPYTFSRTFKTVAGLSPSEFRKTLS